MTGETRKNKFGGLGVWESGYVKDERFLGEF